VQIFGVNKNSKTENMTMRILKTNEKTFLREFKKILVRGSAAAGDVEARVRSILREVQTGGDEALIRLTEQYDKHKLTARSLRISVRHIKKSAQAIPAAERAALTRARARIEAFHCRQLQQSWINADTPGEIVGQIVRPLERVGIYVPGGKAVYPSSVLMNAIPARVAGVAEIIMVTPGSKKGVSPVLLAAADVCGISSVFQIGGAQSIAALAYGSESVPKVDKIVGPGNIYVATAKKLVYGDVDIDMIAGPSEILIISDGSGSPACAAADMLSQAEHDELACSILATPDEGFARRVARELATQIKPLAKKIIAARALENYGAIIITRTLEEAVHIANDVAPEHLELAVEHPWDLLPQIKNAGAVFLGHYSPEALGDYMAGPNHVLPTGGTARFFSPLSVEDFLKKTSIISFTREALRTVAPDIIRIAQAESLDAHARSVEQRFKKHS
jgi:histidinol dehydrogenase